LQPASRGLLGQTCGCNSPGGRPDAGPIGDFRAPEGTVAITADVQGVAPTTSFFDASKLADLMADADKVATGMNYRRWLVG
jgi:hypothetical protein